jgi:nucleotide-binding universal stress UspA family protein
MKRVLVATDGSEAADRAVDYAARLAARENSQLSIVNVVGGYGLPVHIFARFTESQQAWLKEVLESASAEMLVKARDRALVAGASEIRLESREGDVAESVLDIAREQQADIVVVGKRGASAVERLLIGSVSERLVKLAHLPVIVVP